MAATDAGTNFDWKTTFDELDSLVKLRPALEQAVSLAEARVATATLELREAQKALESNQGQETGIMAFRLGDRRIRIIQGVAVATVAESPSSFRFCFEPDSTDLSGRDVVMESYGSLATDLMFRRSGFCLRIRLIDTRERYVIIPTECTLEVNDFFWE